MKLFKYVVLSLFAILVSSASLAAETYSEAKAYQFPQNHFPAVTCNKENCFKSLENRLNTRIISYDNFDDFRGTKALSIGAKSPYVFIFIHGLYGDSRQFNKEAKYVHSLGFNSVVATLPGHGPTAKLHRKLKYQDWIEFTKNIADFSLNLGDKIIVVGQSTGGLLAYWLSTATNYPVEAQVLIEPAFRVKKLLSFATCTFKPFIAKAQDLGFLAELVRPGSSKLEDPVSINMGCQVHKLGKHIFPKHKKTNSEWLIPTNSLFYKTKVRTYISYTKDDDVVEASIIDKFLEVAPWAKKISLNTENDGYKAKHGAGAQNKITLAMRSALYSDKKIINPYKDFLVNDLNLKKYIVRHINFNRLRKFTSNLDSYEKIFIDKINAIYRVATHGFQSIDLNNAEILLPDISWHFIEHCYIRSAGKAYICNTANELRESFENSIGEKINYMTYFTLLINLRDHSDKICFCKNDENLYVDIFELASTNLEERKYTIKELLDLTRQYILKMNSSADLASIIENLHFKKSISEYPLINSMNDPRVYGQYNFEYEIETESEVETIKFE